MTEPGEKKASLEGEDAVDEKAQVTLYTNEVGTKLYMSPEQVSPEH
jgi:hypothetical protein